MINHSNDGLSLRLSQKEMRSAFLGGFAGQLISGLIWIAAAVISLVWAPGYGMAVTGVGPVLIWSRMGCGLVRRRQIV